MTSCSRGKCELTPIEERFLFSYVDLVAGVNMAVSLACPRFSLQNFKELPAAIPRDRFHPREFTFIAPQEQIGRYRVDFVIGKLIATGRKSEESLLKDGSNFFIKLPLVVVECDGHDFHEKTKEQAKRDKERDRVLQKEGYRILRFTGSEIFNDADKCASEVDELFEAIEGTI